MLQNFQLSCLKDILSTEVKFAYNLTPSAKYETGLALTDRFVESKL